MASNPRVEGDGRMDNPLIDWREQLRKEDERAANVLRSGRAMRRDRLKRAQVQIERRALDALLQHLPGLFKEPADVRGCVYLWPLAMSTLTGKYRRQSEFKAGLRAILLCLQQGNTSGYWQLPLPTIPLTVLRRPLPYTEKWFDKAQRCSQALLNWHRQIEARDTSLIEAEDLLADILHSAVFYCGVHQTAILHALMLAIAERRRLCTNGSVVWLPLTLESKALATNAHDRAGKGVTELQIFLSLPTLGLVQRWYRRRGKTFELAVELDTFSLWAQRHLTAPLRGIKEFCQGASLVTGGQAGVRWPQILTHVASGALHSVPLPHENWLSLHHPTVADGHQVVCLAQEASTGLVDNLTAGSSKRWRYHGEDHPYSSLLARLRTVLAEKESATRKQTKASCLAGLNRLRNEQTLSKSEQILVGWLHQCIAKNKNKPSTLRSYLSRGGQQWLVRCFDHDLGLWDGDRFLSCYRALLEEYGGTSNLVVDPALSGAVERTDLERSSSAEPESSSSEAPVSQKNAVSYMAARLTSLHSYAVASYHLAPLPEELVPRERQRPHVRATYLSEPLFRQLLRGMERMTHTSSSYRECLSALYIVAYRAGLRLSEIQKLRLKDIERSPECWLYIRDTRLDDGKSDSATRKIPLGVLLTPEERTRLDAYLSGLWPRKAKNANALAFPSQSGWLIPMSDEEIRGPLTSILRQVGGKYYTFHHLRHTALSRLQLLLHHEALALHSLPGWAHFLPWSAAQCTSIYQTITHSSTQGDYWALAQFAGHQSPETTLHSYLHFTHWVNAACLLQAKYDWSLSLRHHFTGLSRAKLTQNDWLEGPLTWQRCREALLQSLSPYLQQVSWVLMECAPYPPLVKHKLDFDAALELIARFARHEDITDQLNRYQLTPAMVDELVEKIHLLKAFKTQRGAQRLLYSTSHHLNLLPGALRSHKEQIELRKVVKLARQVYREQRAAFIEWIGYLLVRSNTRNTGIPFTDPQMLQAFLSVTVLLLPATRIAIEVRCGAKRSEKAPWREVISRYRVKSEFIEKSGANRALLRIIHPDEAGICQRSTERQQNADTVKPMARYSTPLLRTVAYVVALKVMSIQELVSLGNKKKADFARQTARELTD